MRKNWKTSRNICDKMAANFETVTKAVEMNGEILKMILIKLDKLEKEIKSSKEQ